MQLCKLMKTRTYFLWLALAALITLALRLPFLRCGAFGADVTIFYDEVNYVWLASSLANGDTYADTLWAWTRAPGVALLLLLLSWLRGLPPELVICDFQVVQSVLWVGMLLPLSWISVTLFGRRVAVVAALLLATLPLAAAMSLLVYSETLFSAGTLVTVAALLRHNRHPHPKWLVLAGVAAGLAALSRSAMLPMLPIFALWVAFPGNPFGTAVHAPITNRPPLIRWSMRSFQLLRHQLRLLPPIIFLACSVLTIAPWTVRNYLTYGGIILIDTTGAYTLWANNKVTDVTVVLAMHAVSDNPVERQRYAMEQARRAILSDPARFVRKVALGMVEAWRPTRFESAWGSLTEVLQRSRPAAILGQVWALTSALLPLALLGIVCAPHPDVVAGRYRLVILALAASFALVIGVTHYEDRYRLPFLILLLPHAAWCLAHPQALLRTLRHPPALVTLALIIALIPYYSPYLWPDQVRHAQALALHGRGLLRATWGDIAGALHDQQQAARLEPQFHAAGVTAARLAVAMDDLATAEELLRAVLANARKAWDVSPEAIVLLQHVLLQQGRTAEAIGLDEQHFIAGRRRAEVLAWQQGPAPSSSLAVGDLDLGLVQGFYVREQHDTGAFRWSRPHARLLLAGDGDLVCLRLNAARPPDLPAPIVRLRARLPAAGGRRVELGTIHPPRYGWAETCVPLPTRLSAETLELHLHTPAYNPRLDSPRLDSRNLGVAVAEAWLTSEPLSLDAATGLRLDRLVAHADAPSTAAWQLIGATGTFTATPGAVLPLTLWWRGAQPPSVDTFTFLHLRNRQGTTIADYNAPLAGGQFPQPWVAGEPLLDQTALTLPADLAPGRYRLVGGAFDPTTGAVLVQADLGEVEASFRGQGTGDRGQETGAELFVYSLPIR